MIDYVATIRLLVERAQKSPKRADVRQVHHIWTLRKETYQRH